MAKITDETLASITPAGRAEMLRLLQDTLPDLNLPQQSRALSAAQLFIVESLRTKEQV